MRQFLLALSAVFCFSTFVEGQNTVGLLSYHQPHTYQGYTLIYPHNQPNVYLINNCGEVVHTWTDDADFRPGNTAYLRSDGSLVKTKRNADTSNDVIWAGGGGAFVEIRSWDNDLLWSYEANDETQRLHHDITPMPNGNILMIVWERITEEAAIQAGRDTALLSQDELWPEKIIEVDPGSDEIVWEWRVMDHIIQDFDATKDNYGVVADHRELIDINWDRNEAKADWLHANSLDFNPMLNQIMISIPYFNELWVIDHSTTTEQAAGHNGGFSNHGGDLIYRIGNQQAYQKGDSTDQILYFQHDAHWTNEFIDNTHPDFGKIVVFNNRVGEDFSTVEKFTSSWSMYNSDYESFNGTYPPYEFTETVNHPDPPAIYSRGMSSAQLLPNGNTLICAGRLGYLVELNMDGVVVWEYKTPLVTGDAASQGDTLVTGDNSTFRAFKYPEDYSAFDGRDLTSKGYIELMPDEDYCDLLLPVNSPQAMDTKIYPNPASDRVHFSWDSGAIIDITIYDNLGRRRMVKKGNGGMCFMDVAQLESGIYFIAVDGQYVEKLMVH